MHSIVVVVVVVCFFFFFFFEFASLSYGMMKYHLGPNSSTLPDAASTNFPSIKSLVYFTSTDGLIGTSDILLLKLVAVLPDKEITFNQ